MCGARAKGEYVLCVLMWYKYIWCNVCLVYVVCVCVYVAYRSGYVSVCCVCVCDVSIYGMSECCVFVLYCACVVFTACVLYVHILWGEDGAGVGIYFLFIPFTTYIIIGLQPIFVEGRDSLPHRGGSLNSIPLQWQYSWDYTSLAYSPSSFQSGFQCPLHRTTDYGQAWKESPGGS